MHPAKSKLYYSLIALSFACSAFTLEAGSFKKALDRRDDLEMLQATCISKIHSLNTNLAEAKRTENDPVRIQKLQNKILLFTARNEKINEIKSLTQGATGPLDEMYYVMLKTVETPSISSESPKEEVKEEETKVVAPKTSEIAIQVEEDKEDWDSLNKTAMGRRKLALEALDGVESDRNQGNFAPSRTSEKWGGIFASFEATIGPKTAIENMRTVLNDNTGKYTEEDWWNEYNWPARKMGVKKHNMELIESVKAKLNGPIKGKYSKKS